MTITVQTSNGPVECSSQTNADLVEEFEVLYRGERVTFTTDYGPRQGKVIGYAICGEPRHLSLVIEYRAGRYNRLASEVS